MDELILIRRKLNLIEKRKHHPLKSNDKEIVELLTQCQHSNITSVKISTTVLLHTAQKNWIDLNSFIPDLQLAISTASHPHLVVFLLCDLLRIQPSLTLLKTGLLKGHPLVSIVVNNSSLTQFCVIGSINLLRKHSDADSLYVTKPLFKYLLLRPNHLDQLLFADNLHEQLLQLVRERSPLSSDILGMILNLVSFYRCHPMETLWSTYYRICSICRTVILSEENFKVAYTDRLIDVCLSACVECTKQELSVLELLPNFKQMLQLSQLTVSRSLAISWLLMTHLTEPMTQQALLDIVQTTSLNVPYFILCLLKLPLVLLISQPAPVGSSLWKANRITASQILTSLEQKSDSDDTIANQDVSANLWTASSLSHQYIVLRALASDYVGFIMGKRPNWLDSIQCRMKSKQCSDIISLGIILCALDPVKTSAASLYSLIPQNTNSMGTAMLTFTMYSLVHISDPETHYTLMQSLPSYCSNSLSTELVANTLLTFTKQLDLLPMVLRLLAKSWEKEDKVFAHLRGLLLPPAAGPRRIEWCISSAATLRDICCMRPEQHGEECLPYISQLLSYSEHPLMISLLISALTELCASGVIEPAPLWKLLGPKLLAQDNPGVDIALCGFFKLAAFDVEDQKGGNKIYRKEALKYLWNLALKLNPETIDTALEVITSFPLESHTYSILPDTFVSMLNALPSNESLSAAQILLLFLAVTRQRQETCLSTLIKYLVNEEMKVIPRGLVYNVLQKLPPTGISDKSQIELRHILKRSQSLESVPAVLYLLPDQFSENQSVLKQRDHLLQVTKKALECALHNDMWAFSDGIAWQSFMHTLVKVHIKVSWSKLPEKGEKREEIVNKAINEILHKLRELVRHSVFNGMGAIVGVACSELLLEVTPKVLPMLLEEMMHFLKTNSLSQKSGYLHETFKMLLATAIPEDGFKSILLYIPSLIHCLSQFPWRALEINTQLVGLVTGLTNVIDRCSNSGIVQLACSAVAHILQSLPCKQVVASACQSLVLMKQKILQLNYFSLLTVVGTTLKELYQFDSSFALQKLIDFIQTDGISCSDLQVASSSIISSLPLLLSNGEIPFDEAMKCVQVFADLATTNSKLSYLHWCLGVLVHDLYTVGAGVSLGGLMETLAVRWIQEGLAGLNSSSGSTQLMSSVLGIAGLFGLSPLNYKLRGCTNDSFTQSLLSTGLPFLYQCCSVTDDDTVRSMALWTIANISLQFTQEVEKVPSDFNYLPEGSSLQIVHSQLEQYCVKSNVLITEEQATELIKGLAEIDSSLPPVKWDIILLPMINNALCQEYTIKFVTQQALGNIAGFKHVVEFILHPAIFQSLQESSKRHIILCLDTLSSIISPSQLFSVLVLGISSEQLLICSKSILSLLSADKCSGKLKAHLSTVLELLCQEIETPLAVSSDWELLQPSSSFFANLSQCLNLVVAPFKQDHLRHIVTCSNVITGIAHLSSLSPLLFDYLSSLLSPLEEQWFLYTVEKFCSVSHSKCSYSQTLLLTSLHEWTKEKNLTDTQLTRILYILAAILGAKSTSNFTPAFIWPVDLLQDSVKHKVNDNNIVYSFQCLFLAVYIRSYVKLLLFGC